ncbi:MAG: hypothetical protein J0G32_04835 [Alphaproteobacteria bacterium]|nr:hypothetical protein [Alphaproteobacteria bacterium]OJV14062.1 MAG: hypothetical protein BGO27_01060 [Alphaproteobacteria bacterium 33-17]
MLSSIIFPESTKHHLASITLSKSSIFKIASETLTHLLSEEFEFTLDDKDTSMYFLVQEDQINEEIVAGFLYNYNSAKCSVFNYRSLYLNKTVFSAKLQTSIFALVMYAFQANLEFVKKYPDVTQDNYQEILIKKLSWYHKSLYNLEKFELNLLETTSYEDAIKNIFDYNEVQYRDSGKCIISSSLDDETCKQIKNRIENSGISISFRKNESSLSPIFIRIIIKTSEFKNAFEESKARLITKGSSHGHEEFIAQLEENYRSKVIQPKNYNYESPTSTSSSSSNEELKDTQKNNSPFCIQ